MLHAFFCNPSELHQNCRGKCIDYSMFLLFIIAENGDWIAGFLFEPIQGEAGIGILETNICSL